MLKDATAKAARVDEAERKVEEGEAREREMTREMTGRMQEMGEREAKMAAKVSKLFLFHGLSLFRELSLFHLQGCSVQLSNRPDLCPLSSALKLF